MISSTIIKDATQKLERLLLVAPNYGEITLRVVLHAGQVRQIETGFIEKSQVESSGLQ